MYEYLFLLCFSLFLVSGNVVDGSPRPIPLAKEMVEKMTNVIMWNPEKGGDFFRMTPFALKSYPGPTTVQYASGNFTFDAIEMNGHPTLTNGTYLNMAVRFVNVSAYYQASCINRQHGYQFHQIVTSRNNADVVVPIRIRIDDNCNGFINKVTSPGPSKPFKVISEPPSGPCPRKMSGELSVHYFHGIQNQTVYVITNSLSTSLANFKMC